ncbi:hypothetical protein RQP46_009909 [Phenoliferia psychrophenolica]
MADSTMPGQRLQRRHSHSSGEPKSQPHERRPLQVRTFVAAAAGPVRPRRAAKPFLAALGLACAFFYLSALVSSPRSSVIRNVSVKLDVDPKGPPPTFFTLEPPDALRRDLHRCAAWCWGADLHDKRVTARPIPLPFEEQVDRDFGGPLPDAAKYPADLPYTLHNTDQFSLPGILALRVKHLATLPGPATNSGPSRATLNLNSADFVLLLLDSYSLRRCHDSCPHPNNLPASINRVKIERRVEAWLRDVVAKHGRRRAYPSLVLPLARIDRDYYTSVLGTKMEEDLKNDVVFVGIERESGGTIGKDTVFFEQVPYPSIFSLPLGKTQGVESARIKSELESWLLGQDRPYLVSFAGKAPELPKSGFEVPFSGFDVRRQLASTLAQYANVSTVSLILPSWETRGHTFVTLTHQVMLHARFCLQPPGDSASRKGFWESILLGCIPVVFRRGTYAKVWPQLGIDWDEIALVVEEKGFLEKGSDIVEIVRAVPEEEVSRRQRAVAGLAWRVQYGIPKEGSDGGWAGDAFGMLLRRLDRIKRKGGRK